MLKKCSNDESYENHMENESGGGIIWNKSNENKCHMKQSNEKENVKKINESCKKNSSFEKFRENQSMNDQWNIRRHDHMQICGKKKKKKIILKKHNKWIMCLKSWGGGHVLHVKMSDTCIIHIRHNVHLKFT